MATEDAPELDPESRRELERVAFSRPTNKKESDAAAAAQAKLAALAPAEPEVPEAPVDRDGRQRWRRGEGQKWPSLPAPARPEALEGPPTTNFDDDFEDDVPAPSRRRTLLPLLIAIGLVLGIGGGIAIARYSPTEVSAASTSSPVPTPVHTTSELGNATTALAELASPQTAADKFPDARFADSLDLESSSIHRILTTDDGVTLWIGKSTAAICMVYTGGNEANSPEAGATCASVFEFGDTGLSLRYGRDLWTWDGIGFTTTIQY